MDNVTEKYDCVVVSHVLEHIYDLDDFLRKILSNIAGVDIFAFPTEGTPIPDFVAERASLKTKAGGLGFRRLSQRYLLLNSLNNTMPQAIDRIDEEGHLHPGLWNSLSDFLGQGSFDEANKEHCWRFFHNSGSSFAQDHLALVCRVQERWKSSLYIIGEDATEEVDSIFSVPSEGFGFKVKKLHKPCRTSSARWMRRPFTFLRSRR